MKLRVVAHIANTADGLTATMDSPDQGASGIPASVTRDGAAFKLEVKAVGAVFEGKINQGLDAIDGTFTQNGTPLPLTLKRVKDGASAEPRRPQNPVKPYPYREEDVDLREPGRRHQTGGHVHHSARRGTVSGGGADLRLGPARPRRNRVRTQAVPGSLRLPDAPGHRRAAGR